MARARKRSLAPCRSRSRCRPEAEQGRAQATILNGSRSGKRVRVDLLRGGWNARGLSQHGRLEDAQFGHGPIAEMAVDPLQDLTRAVLHLDGARSVHAENQNRAFVSSPPMLICFVGVVPVPWPDHLVGHGVSGEFGAHDRRPIAEQRRRGEAAGAGYAGRAQGRQRRRWAASWPPLWRRLFAGCRP